VLKRHFDTFYKAEKTPADPPTINRKIARIWFPESQLQATRKSAG